MAEIKTKPEQIAKEATELSAFNGINLGGIKDSLEKMLGQIGRNGIFDEYTKHDISHINIMLGLIDDIIPEQTKTKMTKADWLLIVLSTYFHDLGMLVSKNEFNNRNNNQFFIKYKEAYESKPSNMESLKKLGSDDKERFMYQEYVRKNHGKRISDWLTGENQELYDKKIVELVRTMTKGLKPLFVKDLAIICESHNEDDLENDDKYPVKQEYGMNSDEKGNVFYAALILRTADILHITGDRAPSEEYQIISPSNPTSQIEWAKQTSVSSVSPKEKKNEDGNIDKSIQSDTFSVTGYFEDPKGFFPLMDYLDYARKQLIASYGLNEEKKKKFSMEYDFPWKDIDDSKIRTKDYERRQLSFTIDQQRILDLLVGETLYNNITVSLREIAQNAIDAVRVKKYEYDEKGDNSYEPHVDVKWIPETRCLIVSDNGTGMDMDIIQNHLLKVGSSRYTDKEFQKTHSSYHSISRFGIGLLSCFLVAEDVDILTRTESVEKPLLLKVSKLHGKYLLKYGVEKDSPLSILDNAPSGTSIMLRIKSDIEQFDPEKILRDWILFPACVFTYTENIVHKNIGYENTKALLNEVIQNQGVSLDYSEYKIVGQEESGIDMSILLKRNKFLKEWSFVQYFDIAKNERLAVFPCGISIEGIRIDKNTPGFEQPYFVAIANLSGKKAQARPNVARSAIDSKTIGGVMSRVYDLYLSEIKRQMMDISQEYSITWASSELPFLLEVFDENSHSYMSHTILIKDEFNKSMEKQQYHLLYKNGYSFKSIKELKDIGHFWLIDSSAYLSATNLIREAKATNLSAIGLLKVLYGENCRLFDDVDVVLNDRLFRCGVDRQIIENFEITDIRIFDEYRSMVLKWENKDENEPRWISFAIDHDYDYSYLTRNNSFFVQNNEINIINENRYEAVRCEYGLFVLSGNEICKYIKDLNNKLSTTNESDMRIINTVCSFITKQYSVNHKDEDWAYSFEEFLSKQYTSSYCQKLKSKIKMEDLIKACKASTFSACDRTLWYRR